MEISRRLLGAADADVKPVGDTTDSLWRRRIAALIALVALPRRCGRPLYQMGVSEPSRCAVGRSAQRATGTAIH